MLLHPASQVGQTASAAKSCTAHQADRLKARSKSKFGGKGVRICTARLFPPLNGCRPRLKYNPAINISNYHRPTLEHFRSAPTGRRQQTLSCRPGVPAPRFCARGIRPLSASLGQLPQIATPLIGPTDTWGIWAVLLLAAAGGLWYSLSPASHCLPKVSVGRFQIIPEEAEVHSQVPRCAEVHSLPSTFTPSLYATKSVPFPTKTKYVLDAEMKSKWPFDHPHTHRHSRHKILPTRLKLRPPLHPPLC